MSKPQNVIAKKLVNALMKDAEVGDRAPRLLGEPGRREERVVDVEEDRLERVSHGSILSRWPRDEKVH